MASIREFLPFQQRRGRPPKKATLLNAGDQKAIAKLFKAVGLAIGFTGGTYTGSRVNFEPAPYDFDRIIQAIDTDSYVKQAFTKYKELIWKEGWHIVSENQEVVQYLHQRLDFMELSMKAPFQEFLNDVGDQLVKLANCFIVKVRGDLNPYFPGKLKPSKGKDPVIGYQIIPAETMEIMRDYHNNIIAYRQNIWGASGGGVAAFSGAPRQDDLLPVWKPEDVIHIYIDRKPGRIYGTPFVVSVMDDIVALRQIEEDIQNLIHRELFPLYKYKVGTDDQPAEPDEIEAAANELANLRTEGGLVLPNRHDVEVVGADGNALDANPYLTHFKERVAIGLGLFPHHLGMTSNGGNRSVTDRLDTALYDKIKLYQRLLAEIIQLKIFNELLLEGGFDPYANPLAKGQSDRATFEFNEIDVDTQVKKENHYIQLWTSDGISMEELRIKLNMDPEVDEEKLYSALAQRMLPSPGKPIAPAGKNTSGPAGGNAPTNPALPAGGANNAPRKPDAAKPSVGGTPNPVNRAKKQAGNRSMPANQFGRNLSPSIRHSDEQWLNEVVNLLDDDDDDDGLAGVREPIPV
jgi:hypothetical protein